MKHELFSFKMVFTSCYLIKGTKGWILVDTGMKGGMWQFKRFLKKKKIDPKEIELIILTHGHTDHTANTNEIKKLTGAKVLAHEADKEMFTNGYNNPLKSHVLLYSKGLFFYRPKVESVIPDIMINSDYGLEEYGIDGKIICIPGHTMGSICLYLNEGIMIVGDFTHGRPISIKTGLPNVYENREVMIESLNQVVKLNVTKFYQSHGKPYKKELLENILKKYQNT